MSEAGTGVQELGIYISDLMPDDIISWDIQKNELIISLLTGSIAKVSKVLRDDANCLFKQCVDICGVDYPERENRFEIVYNLLSLTHNLRVRLKVTTDDENPVPSVTDIWPTANWFEREIWDLYGVYFINHPDMRRILTDYGFEGHPLRKDFPLTGHVEMRYDAIQRRVVYEPVKLVQDFRSFDFTSPWEGTIPKLPGDEKAVTNATDDEGKAA